MLDFKNKEFLYKELQVQRRLGAQELSEPSFGTCIKAELHCIVIQFIIKKEFVDVKFTTEHGRFIFRGKKYLVSVRPKGVEFEL